VLLREEQVLTTPTVSDVRSACADLVAAFAYNVDHRLFAEAVALFTVDGCFERADLSASGHAQIAAIWADRPASLVTRHICAAPFFTEVREDRATSVTAFTLYRVESAGPGVPECSVFTAVAEFSDRFQLTPAGWRIAHRKAATVIRGTLR
jgi:hypothetical protein